VSGAGLLKANAVSLPLADESVDLIVTSPPYFSLRSYRDGGEHVDGQIGSEDTPQEFLEALWAVTKECWRVLKPEGSMFVNLGDKRAGSGGHNNAGLSTAGSTLEGIRQQTRTGSWSDKSTLQGNGHVGGGPKAARRQAPDRYNQSGDFNGHTVRRKSKMFLPHRYAIGCEDGLADPEGIGWVARSDLVWSKPNGLPESVGDRVRDSHEYWFHLTRSEVYFSAVDEIRNMPSNYKRPRNAARATAPGSKPRGMNDSTNERGALPGSVWQISTEPLVVPAHLDVDHFAAFPQEWPRRLILGWSPSGICIECGEGRRPVIESKPMEVTPGLSRDERVKFGSRTAITMTSPPERAIVGYACGCSEPPAPTRPAVVLDPFGGTGTTAMVARALGRFGISVDLSSDYLRLAEWRIFHSGHAAKSVSRTDRDRQGMLL